MTDVTKRLRYFDGQVLGAQDFTDEQHYVLDRQHRYSRFLNAAGIVDGLEVSQATAPGQIEVHPGTALDAQGRQVVLSDTRTVSLADCKGQTVEVVIAYSQEEADPQMTEAGPGGSTRVYEKPYVGLRAALPPRNGEPITLAVVTLDHTGVVFLIDERPRVYAGIRLPAGQSEPGGVILRAHTRIDSFGPAAWHDVECRNGWCPYGTESPVQCWKDSQSIVHLRGRLQRGPTWVDAALALLLPEGYRPTSEQQYTVCTSDNVNAQVSVGPDGYVGVVLSAVATWVSLDGITFRAFDVSGGPVWRDVTVSNGWSVDDASPARYWKDNRGIVYFCGALTGGTSTGSVAAQVEIGYRPTHQQLHKTATFNFGVARVDVYPDGRIEVVSGDRGKVWLAGIAFPTEETSAWQDVVWCNNWRRSYINHNPMQYWKDSEGIVYLRGLITGGTIGAENDAGLVFTLPVGYRPAYPQVHTVFTIDPTRGRVDVLPNGNVVVVSGNNYWVSLDDIAFRAENPPAERSEDVLPRIVSGIVTDAGTTQATVGFTVTRISTGLYDITFTPAFAAAPAASVTQIWAEAEQPGGSPLNNTILVSLEQAKMRVKTGNSAGEAADRSFSFIAIGPR